MHSPDKTPSTQGFISLREKPVAIIGMASIFAMAENLEKYWDNILNKVDAITDVPADRWDVESYYDPDPKAPDKSYCKRGGFLPEIDFDPLEFGLPPNILEATDVSQLMGLVAARDALNDAGYGDDHPKYRETTGCILGVVGMSAKLYLPLINRLQYPVWEKVLRKSGVSAEDTAKIIDKIKKAYVGWEENSFPGTLTNVVAGRIANRFNLGGTNCVIDAACGTSLAAMRMAVMELVEGRADMMLTGGVDTDNSIGVFMSFSKTPAFSKGERVRVFDAESDGMIAGEGIGMVVLKRLEDAVRDGDRIYAVIRGIGSSSDGRYKSIYAPRPEGQTLALQRAYTEAGYDPLTSGLIEAHGTGTPAGDPAEFRGLVAAFGRDGEHRGHIGLGSVKSMVGHTKGAAGVAGLIKIALGLHHKILPPTINVTRPNPKYGIEDTAFYINTETRPWFRSRMDIPRRAGVSAFGFGGTNFHFALEEYSVEHDQPYRLQHSALEFVLGAAHVAELTQRLESLSKGLDGKSASQVDNHIPHNYPRIGFAARDAEHAQELIQIALQTLDARPTDKKWDHPRGVYFRSLVADPMGSLVALFPGQGSQYVNMGREGCLVFPSFREALAQMDSGFAAPAEPLTRTIYPPPAFTSEARRTQEDWLTQTRHAQPAIGALSAAMFELFTARGFRADRYAGHSFGELTALWAAGVLTREDFYQLARTRGQVMSPRMSSKEDPGAMLAVKGDAEKIRNELIDFPDVTLANWNSNNQVVLAGSKAAIAQIKAHLEHLGFSTIPLSVSAAFHTPLVGHAREPFAAALRAVPFSKPNGIVYSNSSARAHPASGQAIREALEDHLLSPVLFRDEILKIHADGGRIFVEFGPRSALTNLVRDILAGEDVETIALNSGPRGDGLLELFDAAVRLRVLGVNLSPLDQWQAPSPAREPRKLSPVAVKLSAAGYVSPKTRRVFADALEDGFQIAARTVEKTIDPPAPASPTTIPSPGKEEPGMADSPASIYTRTIQETSQLHLLYLQNEQTTSQALLNIHQRILELLGDPDGLQTALPLIEILERSAAQLVQQQAQTRQVHETFLRTMEDYTRAFAGLNGSEPVNLPVSGSVAVPATQPIKIEPGLTIPKSAAPSAPAPTPAQPVSPPQSVIPPAASISSEKLKEALLAIVSEKTGYPVEMLEMDADMEADLGIDSIKRVEIMGAMREKFAQMPAPDPEAFAAVHSLADTIAYIERSASAISAEEGAAPAPTKPEAGAAQPPNGFKQALLEIVSEKTGYPADMLELDADMESDLGIDSIKRVEIMGAMREQFSAMPAPDPESFADAHTLADILKYIESSPPETPAETSRNAGKTSETGSAPTSSAGMKEDLLAIVSGKTGYPVNMLEMDVDIESDLGIDSIKKVEILGALRENHPELPQPDPQAFTEAHTLQDILDYLGKTRTAGGSAAQQAKDSPQVMDLGESAVLLLTLPPADELVFSLPSGSVCLIGDDGTPLASRLTERLAEKGWNIARFSWPESIQPAGAPARYSLDSLAEEEMANLLETVKAQAGPIAAFIHLHPCCGLDKDREKALVKSVFLLAKQLKKPLTDAAGKSGSLFAAVTRLDGSFGLTGQGDYHPLAGSLAGLVKTANREWQQVTCKSIDLAPELETDMAVSAIMGDIFDPNRRLVEIGHNSSGRVTLAAQTTNQPA